MTPAQIMEAQFFFQRRLREHGVTIHFYGMTDIPGRWDQIRAAIIGSHFEDKDFGSKGGAKETYRDCFERIANEPLEREEDAA